jgi:hypothetical protein
MTIVNVQLVPGYLRITDDNKRSSDIAIADVLRAADIPLLTYRQVAAISTLANLVIVLIRTLKDRDILDDAFGDNDWETSLEDIATTVESLGGNVDAPDILVPELTSTQ